MINRKWTLGDFLPEGFKLPDGGSKSGQEDKQNNNKEKPAQRFMKSTDHTEHCAGFILGDGTIGEMCVDPDTKERGFIVSSNKEDFQQVLEYVGHDGTIYIPFKEKFIGRDILLPSQASEYKMFGQLFEIVRSFIRDYVDLPFDYEGIATLYVFLTWVYDALPSVPYLRLRGESSTGKSRFLRVVGSICYRPIFCSGAITTSPVFRILEKCPGTLILDEADWRLSDTWAEIIKILNSGYEPGTPVWRCGSKDDRKWEPDTFHVYGPKIIATRKKFQDDALESRCLTCVMAESTRKEIPFNLPPDFHAQALELRNKLLTYRLQNWHKVKVEAEKQIAVGDNLIPRVNQVMSSMATLVVNDMLLLDMVKDYAGMHNDELMGEKRESIAAMTLTAIVELKRTNQKLTMTDVADKLCEQNYYLQIEPRKVAYIVRNILGLGIEKDKDTRRTAIAWNEDKINLLCRRYGIANTNNNVSNVSDVSSRT